MLNMHIQRNCHAQLQTGPKPLKSEAPAFSVVWFLNFGMLRYVWMQKLLFTRPRWPIPKTIQPARSSDAARPWLGTKFNSTHISAKMDFELLGFSALHHQSPALLRMAWCQIMHSEHSERDRAQKKTRFRSSEKSNTCFWKLFWCSGCFWLRWKANSSVDPLMFVTGGVWCPFPTLKGRPGSCVAWQKHRNKYGRQKFIRC